MSKNDIRLRKQKFALRGPDRFRNYGAVLQRHEREMLIKKVLRVFMYLFIIMIIVMMIIMLARVEKKAEKRPTTSSLVLGSQAALQKDDPKHPGFQRHRHFIYLPVNQFRHLVSFPVQIVNLGVSSGLVRLFNIHTLNIDTLPVI